MRFSARCVHSYSHLRTFSWKPRKKKQMQDKSRRTFLKTSTAVAVVGAIPSLNLRLFAGDPQNISTKDEQLFWEAIRTGNLASVKQQVAKARDLLKLKDKAGLSCFALALLLGHNSIADFFKATGYESDLHESALAQDWDRFDAIVKSKGNEIVEFVNSDHPIGGTAMYAAASAGAGQDMWRIYALGADPNASPRGKKGISPIQKALRFRDLKTSEITAAAMLSNNASPNPPTNSDAPPLHIASERGSREMVEMLIRLGANVDARYNKKSAAQLAEKNGFAEVVNMLKNHDVIPRTCRTSRVKYDAAGNDYRIPDFGDISLFERRKLVGQSHGNLDYVKEAIKKDPRMAHSVATTSEICVEAGAHMGNKPIVEVLLKSGAPYSLPTAVMMNDIATVKRYLDEDADRIHERGAHDYPLLSYPVIGKCPIEMLELLIDRGGKVEQQHFLGTTALHWAAQRSDLKAVELLISNGADVNRVGRKFKPSGETPRMMARDAKITAVLVANGAN